MSDSGDNGDVIYKKGEHDSELEDIWDDTELIKAYDKTVNLAYDAAHASLKANGDLDDVHFKSEKKSLDDDKQTATTSKKPKKRSKAQEKQPRKFKVGDVCMAKYSEDDLYYECVILSMDANNCCVVKFAGYDNEEKKPVGTLRRLSEWNSENGLSDSGEESRSTVNMSSSNEANKSGDESKFLLPKFLESMTKGKDEIGRPTAVPLLPPPMPPGFLRPNDGPPSDNEAMSSMLMSWYMSGYHTGYYQALNDIKKKRSRFN